MLKASGTSAGVPDLLIFDPCGGYVGTALEMKRIGGTASNVSAVQRRWMELLEARNWYCVVGYGAEDALSKLSTIGYEVTL
jgi:hypothetical protein